MRQQRDYVFLARHSRGLILALQAPNGAYPASPDFSAYQGYAWFRDGSFIAEAMSAVGEVDSATAFHDWCQMTLLKQETNIEKMIHAELSGNPLPDDQMLPTRFTLEGDLGKDDWWDFQLDGFGTWLWAVIQHAQRHQIALTRWADAIELVCQYLMACWKRPCYDWWEEHNEQVHTSTLGCIVAGLRAAGDAFGNPQWLVEADVIQEKMLEVCVKDGYLTKWIGSGEVDGSLSSLFCPLEVFLADSPIAVNTVAKLEQDLLIDHGVRRFKADTYYGGGRWPLLSCFLGLTYCAQGRDEDAQELFEWVASTANPAGDMPEQVPEMLSFPDRRKEWLERWGKPAHPLLWTHAMFLLLGLRLGIIAPQNNELAIEKEEA